MISLLERCFAPCQEHAAETGKVLAVLEAIEPDPTHGGYFNSTVPFRTKAQKKREIHDTKRGFVDRCDACRKATLQRLDEYAASAPANPKERRKWWYQQNRYGFPWGTGCKHFTSKDKHGRVQVTGWCESCAWDRKRQEWIRAVSGAS
jgi:hypothetical protein